MANDTNTGGLAVITGAGGALGRATALRQAKDGRTVAATDVDADGLRETERLVAAHGGRCLTRVLDLCDEAAIADFFSSLEDECGPVETLINNAAIYPSVPFLEMTTELYERVTRVNQRGYWLCAQHAARQMTRGTGNPSIVNVASITMHGGWENLAAYVATKGAATALTRALARELGPLGIRVNAVSPGAFPTAAELIHENPQAYEQHVIEHQSLKRRGDPTELAAVIAFLTGPDATFVTGQTIEVNGGWVMT